MQGANLATGLRPLRPNVPDRPDRPRKIRAMTVRIVLDTDMGSDVDDALCLALAAAAPELELLAVTHVSKDTVTRARISRRLLELAGQPDVPVFAGCARPLAGPDRFVWFGHEGEGILDTDATPRVEGEDAVDALVRLFGENDGLGLVAVGPLTNIAAALRRDARFARRVGRLTLMGGYVRRSGLEYNLCADPEAALTVFRSGMPIFVVPGDVTLQTWLRESDLLAIEARGTPLHRALVRAVRIWTPIMRAGFRATGEEVAADNVAYLHDPLTLACAYDESFVTVEELDVEPVVDDGLFRLRECRGASADAVRIRCATAVDAERFRSHFVARLRALPR